MSPEYFDTTPTYTDSPNITRSATLVVAASDSSDASKAQADYVCDGTADDVQIQAAIDALGSTGGTVKLLEGTFSLSDNIANKTKVSIIGSGFSTLLRIASGVSVHAFYSHGQTDFYIADLAIDLSLAGTAQAAGDAKASGVYIDHTTPGTKLNITVRNLYISGAQEEGIVTLSGDHIYMLDNIIEDSVAHGIHTDNQNYLVIKGNIIRNSTLDGIKLSNNTNHSLVVNNVIEGVSQYGLDIEDSYYNNVVNNVVRNSRSGIMVAKSITSGSNYNKIIGNTIRATTTSSGMSILACKYNVIKGNSCSECNTYGIQESTAGADYNIFKDNMLLDNTGIGISAIGTHNTYDLTLKSSILDLSGSAADVEVFHAIAPCVLVGYQIVYTQASTSDVGVAIRVGRYNGSDVNDYFDTSTSEVSKAKGYFKHFATAVLTQKVIAAGDTVTVGTAGGKTGDGEVMIILQIAEMAD